MLSVGDVDLLPAQKIMPFITGRRTSADCGKIRPRLGFGEIHCAGPPARHHCREILGFLCVATLKKNSLGSGLGKHGAQSKRHIGAIPHLLHGTGQGLRQPLATVLRIEDQARPATFAELGVCLPPGLRRGDDTINNGGATLISRLVDWRKYVGGELRCLIEDSVNQIIASVFETRP